MSRRILPAVAALLSVVLPAYPQYPYEGFGLPPAGNAVYVRTLLTAVDGRERVEAARRLGRSGDERVIQALARAAVSDDEPRVRQEASEAITRIRRQTGTAVVPEQGLPGGFPGFQPPVPPALADPHAELVQAWYQRYLRRSVDWNGLQNWVGQFRRGMTQEQVQAALLGSDEYYQAHGGRPAGFVRGLYEDVLGRQASWGEVRGNVDRLNRLRGDRAAYAEQFLSAAVPELLRRGAP